MSNGIACSDVAHSPNDKQMKTWIIWRDEAFRNKYLHSVQPNIYFVMSWRKNCLCSPSRSLPSLSSLSLSLPFERLKIKIQAHQIIECQTQFFIKKKFVSIINWATNNPAKKLWQLDFRCCVERYSLSNARMWFFFLNLSLYFSHPTYFHLNDCIKRMKY